MTALLIMLWCITANANIQEIHTPGILLSTRLNKASSSMSFLRIKKPFQPAQFDDAIDHLVNATKELRHFCARSGSMTDIYMIEKPIYPLDHAYAIQKCRDLNLQTVSIASESQRDRLIQKIQHLPETEIQYGTNGIHVHRSVLIPFNISVYGANRMYFENGQQVPIHYLREAIIMTANSIHDPFMKSTNILAYLSKNSANNLPTDAFYSYTKDGKIGILFDLAKRITAQSMACVQKATAESLFSFDECQAKLNHIRTVAHSESQLMTALLEVIPEIRPDYNSPIERVHHNDMAYPPRTRKKRSLAAISALLGLAFGYQLSQSLNSGPSQAEVDSIRNDLALVRDQLEDQAQNDERLLEAVTSLKRELGQTISTYQKEMRALLSFLHYERSVNALQHLLAELRSYTTRLATALKDIIIFNYASPLLITNSDIDTIVDLASGRGDAVARSREHLSTKIVRTHNNEMIILIKAATNLEAYSYDFFHVKAFPVFVSQQLTVLDIPYEFIGIHTAGQLFIMTNDVPKCITSKMPGLCTIAHAPQRDFSSIVCPGKYFVSEKKGHCPVLRKESKETVYARRINTKILFSVRTVAEAYITCTNERVGKPVKLTGTGLLTVNDCAVTITSGNTTLKFLKMTNTHFEIGPTSAIFVHANKKDDKRIISFASRLMNALQLKEVSALIPFKPIKERINFLQNSTFIIIFIVCFITLLILLFLCRYKQKLLTLKRNVRVACEHNIRNQAHFQNMNDEQRVLALAPNEIFPTQQRYSPSVFTFVGDQPRPTKL